MPPIITVEDVEHFRASDIRSVILARHRLVVREAASTVAEPVYTVVGQRVELRLVPGGCTAAHDCASCATDQPCFRALAAVDAEGTERWIERCDTVWHATKLEAAR